MAVIEYPPGVTAETSVLWGAGLVRHLGEGDNTFSYFAMGGVAVDRMATTLGELMDQRGRLLAREGPDCWVTSPRAPAVIWWPTPGAKARHGELAARIINGGARLGVYLYPPP
jgi:hypothetical protein